MTAIDLKSTLVWESTAPRAPHVTKFEFFESLMAHVVPGVGAQAIALKQLTHYNVTLDQPKLESISPRRPMWLNDVYAHVAENAPDPAIDILFDHVNDLLFEDQFTKCNDLLHAVDLKRLDTNLLVALLSITAPARDVLSDREWLVKRIEDRLLELAPDRVEKLMSGLR